MPTPPAPAPSNTVPERSSTTPSAQTSTTLSPDAGEARPAYRDGSKDSRVYRSGITLMWFVISPTCCCVALTRTRFHRWWFGRLRYKASSFRRTLEGGSSNPMCQTPLPFHCPPSFWAPAPYQVRGVVLLQERRSMGLRWVQLLDKLGTREGIAIPLRLCASAFSAQPHRPPPPQPVEARASWFDRLTMSGTCGNWGFRCV